MSFLLNCPNCGKRGVSEFRFGGEVVSRPAPGAAEGEWTSYFYFRPNAAGVQREWWNHRYDTNEIVAGASARGMNPVIPPKSNRKEKRDYAAAVGSTPCGIRPTTKSGLPSGRESSHPLLSSKMILPDIVQGAVQRP